MRKVGPRRLPEWTLKSIKIDIWPSVLRAPLDPMITKMMPQVPKIQPEDLQNDNLRYTKTLISVANQPAAPCIQGGRRQGRSLKIRRTPRRGAAGRDGIATEKKHQEGFRLAPPLPLGSNTSKIVEISDLEKCARELQNEPHFDPRRAPKIVKSVNKCNSRAPSDPFRQ